jgi:hypothetical protein
LVIIVPNSSTRDFLEYSPAQQTQVLDKLAYVKRVPPELEQALVLRPGT